MRYYKTELFHHGVKGQKWGVRRYQNLDGTYTSIGKKRRNNEKSNDYKRVEELSKRNISTLSNAELRELNQRMKIESEYRQQLNARKKKVNPYLKQFANTAINSISQYLINEYAKPYIKKFLLKKMAEIALINLLRG